MSKKTELSTEIPMQVNNQSINIISDASTLKSNKNKKDFDYINTFEECLKTLNYIFEVIEASSVEETEKLANVTQNTTENKASPKPSFDKQTVEYFENFKLKYTIDPFQNTIVKPKCIQNLPVKKILIEDQDQNTDADINIETSLKDEKVLASPISNLLDESNVISYLDDSVESKILLQLEKVFTRYIKMCLEDDLKYKFRSKLNKTDKIGFDHVRYLLQEFVFTSKINDLSALDSFDSSILFELRWLILLNYFFITLDFLFNLCWGSLQVMNDIYKLHYGKLIMGETLLRFYYVN